MLLTAVTVSVASRIVGALMISSLLVIPAASAMLIAKSYRHRFAAAIAFAEFFTIAGLVISYYLDLRPWWAHSSSRSNRPQCDSIGAEGKRLMRSQDILVKAGLKCTSQRINIINILKENGLPMTAEEIFKKTNRISLSTVYRALDLFSEKGDNRKRKHMQQQ